MLIWRHCWLRSHFFRFGQPLNIFKTTNSRLLQYFGIIALIITGGTNIRAFGLQWVTNRSIYLRGLFCWYNIIVVYIHSYFWKIIVYILTDILFLVSYIVVRFFNIKIFQFCKYIGKSIKNSLCMLFLFIIIM